MPHAKVKSLDSRLSRAVDLSLRARIHLDLFIATKLDVNASRHKKALLEYNDYFRFSRIANEWTFFVRINNLFTRKQDTNNLPMLLEELEYNSQIEPEIAKDIRQRLDLLNRTRKSVKHIRDKAIAHQDDDLTQGDVYKEAQISLDLMTELSDASLEIANTLAATHGQPPRSFFDAPRQTLERLLLDIKAGTKDEFP